MSREARVNETLEQIKPYLKAECPLTSIEIELSILYEWARNDELKDCINRLGEAESVKQVKQVCYESVPATIEQLKAAIIESCENGGSVEDFDNCFEFDALTGIVNDDLEEVQVDFENFEFLEAYSHAPMDKVMGFHTMQNGFSFLGCMAGGDWEAPVFFILYLDVDGDLRAYFPERGNTYWVPTSQAYGNGPAGSKYESADNAPEPDQNLLLEDIKSKFVIKEPHGKGYMPSRENLIRLAEKSTPGSWADENGDPCTPE